MGAVLVVFLLFMEREQGKTPNLLLSSSRRELLTAGNLKHPQDDQPVAGRLIPPTWSEQLRACPTLKQLK